MLVLTRKRNESIVINDVIRITVVDIRGDKVRLGIDAPRDIQVHRQEVYELIHGKSGAKPEDQKQEADQTEQSASATESTDTNPPSSS